MYAVANVCLVLFPVQISNTNATRNRSSKKRAVCLRSQTGTTLRTCECIRNTSPFQSPRALSMAPPLATNGTVKLSFPYHSRPACSWRLRKRPPTIPLVYAKPPEPLSKMFGTYQLSSDQGWPHFHPSWRGARCRIHAVPQRSPTHQPPLSPAR